MTNRLEEICFGFNILMKKPRNDTKTKIIFICYWIIVKIIAIYIKFLCIYRNLKGGYKDAKIRLRKGKDAKGVGKRNSM